MTRVYKPYPRDKEKEILPRCPWYVEHVSVRLTQVPLRGRTFKEPPCDDVLGDVWSSKPSFSCLFPGCWDVSWRAGLYKALNGGSADLRHHWDCGAFHVTKDRKKTKTSFSAPPVRQLLRSTLFWSVGKPRKNGGLFSVRCSLADSTQAKNGIIEFLECITMPASGLAFNFCPSEWPKRRLIGLLQHEERHVQTGFNMQTTIDL